MKVSKTLLSILSVLLLLTLLLASGGALAQAPDPQSPAPQDPAPGGYAILPPMPDPDRLPTDRRLSRQEALLLAEKIRNQQLRDLRLKTGASAPLGLQGQAVLAADLSLAAALPEGAALIPEKQAEACQARYVQALSDQIWALSREDASPQEASAPDPSIIVYAPESSDWSYISGRTGTYIEVQFQIFRQGVLYASGAGRSGSGGYYSFMPDWIGCQGYRWRIQPGDVVIVSAHGATTSMKVARLSAWADGARNVVEGQTDPGREVRISLYVAHPQMACYVNRIQKTVRADAAGKFLADFVNQADFDGRAFADIEIVDSNGSITHGELDAMHLYTTPDAAAVAGVIKPNLPVDARLSRGGGEIAWQQATSDPDGWFAAYFAGVDGFQKGDLITVRGGGITLRYSYIPVSVSADGAQQQAFGKTDPGRTYIGFVEAADASSYGPVVNTCNPKNDCAAGSSDARGNFAIFWGTYYNPEAGDSLFVQVFDPAGNYSYLRRGFPVLNADISSHTVSGYWTGPVDVLTVTLKSSSGEVLEKGNPVVSAVDGQFDYSFGQVLVPGQRIEVSDGTGVREMTIGYFGAVIYNTSKTIHGVASIGKVVGLLDDFQGSTFLGTACQSQASTGAYTLEFSELTIGGRDRAHIFNVGTDGNFTSRRAAPFYVEITPELGEVFITTLEPYEPVTIQLWRNNVRIEEIYTNSSSDHSLYAGFSTAFLPDDWIKVDARMNMDALIPDMSVEFDPAKNLVSGKTISNVNVDISIFKPFFLGKGNLHARHMASFPARTQANGEFALDLTGRYDSECNPFVAGTSCQYPLLTLSLTGEHTVQKFGSPAAPVQADAFEAGAGDNVWENAVLYSDKSRHTFHVETDEDWIKIQIPAGQVGKKLYLATTDVGLLSDTVMELYDLDGITLLANNDDAAADYRSLIQWTPAKAGTYFVRIYPAGPYAAANCGSFYTFEVQRSRLALPAIFR